MDSLRLGKLLDRYLYTTVACLGITLLISAFSDSPRPLYAWALFALPLCVLAIIQSTRFLAELSILALAALVRWIVRRLWRVFRIGPEPFAPHLPPHPQPVPQPGTSTDEPRRATSDHPVI